MHHTKADFLAAIKASPDDDTLRLVYADWLDEHGEALRAEFVRVQVELAKLPEPASVSVGGSFNPHALQCRECREGQSLRPVCRFHELRAREAELYRACDRGECGWEMPAIYGFHRLIRGFLSDLGMTWRECEHFLDDLVAEHPISHVILSDRPNLMVNLTDGPVEKSPYDTYRVYGNVIVAGERIAVESHLSRSEMRTSRYNLLETTRAQVILKLSPEKVLPLRWPGVEFEMPFHGEQPSTAADVTTPEYWITPG